MKLALILNKVNSEERKSSRMTYDSKHSLTRKETNKMKIDLEKTDQFKCLKELRGK